MSIRGPKIPKTPSPPKTALAFQDDPILATPGPLRDKLLAQMKAMGAKDVRYNVIYGKTRGGTDLRELDGLVDAAKAHGLRVQPTLMSDPKYLNPTGGLTYANNDPKLWAQFAANVAQREKGRIGRFAVGNEPNLDSFIDGAQADPHKAGVTYRNLYRAAYGAIKGANPGAQVLLGEVTTNANAGHFLQGVMGGKRLHAAGFAYHPYQDTSGTAPWDINKLGALQQTLGRYKRQGKFQTAQGKQVPLYLTEFGYQRSQVPNDTARARMIAAGYRKAQQAGARQFLQYQLTDKTGMTRGPSDAYGNPAADTRKPVVWDTSVGSADGDLSQFARALRSTPRIRVPRVKKKRR